MSTFDQGCQAGEKTDFRLRRPVYAGSWYPGDAGELRKTIDHYFSAADIPDITGRVIGLVAPHAGFIYSGPVAAYSYKAVRKQSPEVVILLGNAHREGFKGAAIDDAGAYGSPLGTVPVDTEFCRRLAAGADHIHLDGSPHLREHSLEIQIPFLQQALKPGFRIVPILFGFDDGPAENELVERLEKLLKNKEFLLVSSTDLTHYPTYSEAQRIDTRTADIIASMNVEMLTKHETMEMSNSSGNLACVLCGSTATTAVIRVARAMGADRGCVLRVANSGDVPQGDRSQVVGYAAVAFLDGDRASIKPADTAVPVDRLTDEEQNLLLSYSREVMTEFVKTGKIRKQVQNNRLAVLKRGVFVSLHVNHDLRGCIGYIEPVASCLDAVRDNTISACARDPRFPPVTEPELDGIKIEISVLTPPQPVESWHAIEIGRHGIILEKNRYKAVFLPQVAPEQGWNLETTLRYLSMKAGLSPDGWREGARFKVFEAQVFGETD